MSWLSSAARTVGKTGRSVLGAYGDFTKKVAPLASFIPGVGPLVSAGLGASGGLMGTLNDKGAGFGTALKNAATGAAIGGAGGYGIDRLQGLAAGNGGGVSGIARGIMGGRGNAAPAVAGAVQPRTGGIGGAIGGILSTLGGGNGAENQLKALGLLGTGVGGYLQGRSEDANTGFEHDQITYARERNAALDPQRQAVLNAILARIGGVPAPATGGVNAGTTPAVTAPSSPRYHVPVAPRTSPVGQYAPLAMPASGNVPPPSDAGTPWSPPAFTPPPTYGPSVPGLTQQTPGFVGSELTHGWEGMDGADGMDTAADPYDLFDRRRKPLTSMAY